MLPSLPTHRLRPGDRREGSGVPTGHVCSLAYASRQWNWRAIVSGPYGTSCVATLAPFHRILSCLLARNAGPGEPALSARAKRGVEWGPSDNSPAFPTPGSLRTTAPRPGGTLEIAPQTSIPTHTADRNPHCVSSKTPRTLPQNCVFDDALAATECTQSYRPSAKCQP